MLKKEQDCINEKWSARTVGWLILPLALLVGIFGMILLPVVGLIFAVPLFLFSFMFIFAPESKVCKLILRRDK